jgi:beta-lactamase class D
MSPMRPLVLLFVAACAHASSVEPSPAAESREAEPGVESRGAPSRRPDRVPDPVTLVTRPDLARHFEAVGFTGGFVAWRDGASEGVCVGECDERRPSASTFKVPHALLALELVVLDGPEHLLPWDGETRSFESWNRDHTLRTAIRDSVVWYFQRLAPFIGRPRMQAGLERFAFGNATIGERLDAFWLDGTLRISPREQVVFWHRLHDDAFDVRPEAREAVLAMTELARRGEVVMRGKTGWYRVEGESNVGWLVGCVQSQERTCFATAIRADDPVDQSAFMAARHTVTDALLRELGVEVPRD